MAPLVSAHGLRKSFGRTEALRGVGFEVAEGEIYGLIGPDGAGKSTLFRILATLLKADGGTATIDGLDVLTHYRPLRRRIGYMPGRFSLYQDLTVEENLAFFASIFGTTLRENYHLVADIYRQLEPFRHRRAGQLSGGMKQKLALSCTLIHAPRLLLLDEPTTGVDPVSRKEFWDTLRRLRDEQGISVIVSTPYMDEATQCDRIALIQEGAFLRVDTPQGIVDAYADTLWAVRSDRMHRLQDDLHRYPAVRTAFPFCETFHVTLHPGASARALCRHLEDCGHNNVEVRPICAGIEDCFMSLMKKSHES